VTIEEQIEFIINSLGVENQIGFVSLVKEIREKLRLIVTFIALLELVKMGRIGLKESSNFNDFVIYGIELNG
jgi:segregation and condensation protein A